MRPSSRSTGLPPRARYCWDIFTAPILRDTELAGTPYRYWSTFAITHYLRQRLSGRIDFLDAGGRDGGTLSLLRGLGLRGHYTLLDLDPRPFVASAPDFTVEVLRSPFSAFQPTRTYDAILFQSCLEYVQSYSEIAWVRRALKPGGFVIATIACRNTRRLYYGWWAQGGTHLVDEADLPPLFESVGLRVVAVCPLAGAVSRVYQRLIFNPLNRYAPSVYKRTLGRASGEAKNPLLPLFRRLNPVAMFLDRLLPFWRIGHCVILEAAD